MRLTRTIGGWAREGNTWLVLLALVLGVVLPAACVIWFMTEAASNQADAARQRLSDSLRGQLQLLRDRIDSDWRSRVGRLRGIQGSDATAFRRAVTSGGLDSIVYLDHDRVIGYQVVVAPAPKPGDADTDTDWSTASALEASGSYAAAAAQYAGIAARERHADRAARAAQAQVRSLLRARDTSGALRAIEQYGSTPRLAAGRDRDGRLIAADARLMSLRLLSPSDTRFRRAADALTALVNDYDVAMPSSQRLFVMSELHAAGIGLSLPTYAAEQLADEFLETDGAAPAGETLESTRISSVWKMAVGARAIALFRTSSLTAMADTVLNGQSVANGAIFALSPPGHEGGSESIPASPLLPGWHLRVSLSGSPLQERTANQGMTTYLWAGSLAVAGLAVAGLLLWQAFRRQMGVSRLKTDLVAAVSHELRTPLTSMRALVDLLLENPAIDRQTSTEYLRMIAGENARLSRLIEHVLAFSRADRNGYGLVFRDVSPDAVVREAAAVQGRERFPGLTLDVAPDLAPLYGDEDALVTVLLNLLENAYKYSGDDRRVWLRARQEAAGVVIEVEDNGIGIARRERKRIFRPFYQVDQRLARERGGCGLGLSIVDFIVRAHGGRVTVESEPGAGALFRVVLPSRSAQREAAA